MNAIEQYQTINPEILHELRIQQLKRLLTFDLAFADILVDVNQIESTMPSDWVRAAQETRTAIQVGIVGILGELGDKDARKFGLAKATTMIVQNDIGNARKEVKEHIIFLQGNEKPVRQHGFPHDGPAI
mgnify:CR=1 FL=1